MSSLKFNTLCGGKTIKMPSHEANNWMGWDAKNTFAAKNQIFKGFKIMETDISEQ